MKDNRVCGVRMYGESPYRVAVIHGGPGAPGYMAPVGRELGKTVGVLEPLQSSHSFRGQVEELEAQLGNCANSPVSLIGSSWGAVLVLFVAARQRTPIREIILVGSPVFDAASSAKVEERRLERMDEKTRERHWELRTELEGAPESDQRRLMREWAELLFHTDVYDPITRDLEILDYQYETNKVVWSEFLQVRDKEGALGKLLSAISVPTVVIHGDFDPHPIDGIRPLLESSLKQVTFSILPECGHYPWIERRAKDRFFGILRKKLKSVRSISGAPRPL